MFNLQVLLFTFIALQVGLARVQGNQDQSYLHRRVTPTGKEEVYLSDGQVWGVQVRTAGRGSKKRNMYTQLSDGHKLITTVYASSEKGKNITSCDIYDGRTISEQFIQGAKSILVKLRSKWQGEKSANSLPVKGKTALQLAPQLKEIGFPNMKQMEAACVHANRELKPEVEESGAIVRDAVDGQDEDARFIAPGTSYCGPGHRGGSLGWFNDTDACCRDHDACPYNIPSHTTRYGIYNRHMYTISWHTCDLRFKLCLKTVDSTPANIIGEIYFRLISPPTFILPDIPPAASTQAKFSKEKIKY